MLMGTAHCMLMRIPHCMLMGVPHRLQVLRHRGEYLFVGGRHRTPTRHDDGVWLVRSSSWRWNESVPTPLEPTYLPRRGNRFARPPNGTGWGGAVRLFGGDELGCIERRSRRDFPYLVPRRDAPRFPSSTRGETARTAEAGAAAEAGACEFDGRLSLAYLNGRFLLYARANVAARNARSVQVRLRTELLIAC